MTITSFSFLGFIILSLVIYHLFPVNKQWLVLLAASAVFYLSFSVSGLFVMILTALLTYFAALQVQKKKDEFQLWLTQNKSTADKETRKAAKALYQNRQKLYVAGTAAVIIGVLFMSKYYKGLAADINGMFQTKLWTAENILLPLGISYYSLQLIGYLVDVHRDIIPAEKNPLKVILYGGFFLSIMQGPFNRYNDLMPQICVEERRKLTYHDIKFAVIKMAGGYIKKLCIADQAALIANEVFNHYENYAGWQIVKGVICFAIQLYADFSGYMDIVIGIGQLFGITIPDNFRQPFFSKNMSEFWKRWHITLGMWLQDYVFYPVLKSSSFKKLGKSLTGKFGKEAGRRIPTYIGMMILWILIGAWHGAGMNYVFGVGILQFIYIFTGEIFAPVHQKFRNTLHIDDRSLPWHIFQSLRCTVLMMFAWIFFRSPSFNSASGFIGRLFAAPVSGNILSAEAAGPDNEHYLGYLFVCSVVMLLIDLLHERGKSLRTIVSRKPYPVRLAFYLLLVFTLIVFGAYGTQYVPSNFIYFEF